MSKRNTKLKERLRGEVDVSPSSTMHIVKPYTMPEDKLQMAAESMNGNEIE